MSKANPLWGAPRLHSKLLKLGIDVSQATVAKYLVRRRRPPSQTWRTFLANHVTQIMAADFFVVATITYRLLFVLVILAHDRRRVVHVAVTNAYAERVIGSSRRECLDHVVVMTEAGLRRIVAQYLAYYHHAPTHLALNKDAPVPRPVTAHGIVAIRSSAGSIIDTDRRAA